MVSNETAAKASYQKSESEPEGVSTQISPRSSSLPLRGDTHIAEKNQAHGRLVTSLSRTVGRESDSEETELDKDSTNLIHDKHELWLPCSWISLSVGLHKNVNSTARGGGAVYLIPVPKWLRECDGDHTSPYSKEI